MSWQRRDLEIRTLIAAPAAPVITNEGGDPEADDTTYEYVRVRVDAHGDHSAASAVGATETGAEELNGDDFNVVTWTGDGYISKIYRKTGGDTQGLIATLAASVTSLDDTGLEGDDATAPATTNSGIGSPVDVRDMREKLVQLGGTFVATFQLQGTLDQELGWVNVGTALTAPGVVEDIPRALAFVRLKNTAHTSSSDVAGVAVGFFP